MERYLIINADDFGASEGINRGIIECHRHGVLTSTSLMVTGRAVDHAVRLSQDNPAIGIGLHFDLWGEDEREFNTHNLPATRDEFLRQVDEFIRVMGRPPTHIDSHRHVHREAHLFGPFLEWTRPLGLPVRDASEVRFVGGFYAQWEWRVTELKYISVAFLENMLRDEVPSGFTEFSCHPGYTQADYSSVYNAEREEEIRTLTDPRIRHTIEALGIRLIHYGDFKSICLDSI